MSPTATVEHDILADFEAFAAGHRPAAVRRVAAKVGWAAAEDIVQDVLVAVWRRWQILADPAGYLYGACEYAVKTEYRRRKRGPATIAELPEPPHWFRGDDPAGPSGAELVAALGLDDLPMPVTVVAALLSDGYDRERVAELCGMPLTAVHAAVRQLRGRLRATVDDVQAVPEASTVDPSPLGAQTARALRCLPNRQRDVLALSGLGLRPAQISGLLGIEANDARVNLCHARRKVAAAAEAGSDDVDTLIRGALGPEELLSLLPNTPWRRDASLVARFSSGLEQALEQLLDVAQMGGTQSYALDIRLDRDTLLDMYSSPADKAARAIADPRERRVYTWPGGCDSGRAAVRAREPLYADPGMERRRRAIHRHLGAMATVLATTRSAVTSVAATRWCASLPTRTDFDLILADAHGSVQIFDQQDGGAITRIRTVVMPPASGGVPASSAYLCAGPSWAPTDRRPSPLARRSRAILFPGADRSRSGSAVPMVRRPRRADQRRAEFATAA